jgi:hypothetical protein
MKTAQHPEDISDRQGFPSAFHLAGVRGLKEGGEGVDGFLKALFAFLVLFPQGTGNAPEDIPDEERNHEAP